MRSALIVFVALLFSTAAFAQSADQEILSAVDSPDPIVPGNNITYTVTVRNNGPDPAVNGGVNIVLSGSVVAVSASGPAGFTCTAPSQFMSCTSPSFAFGTAVFTIVAQVPASLLNFPDGSVSSTFGTSGTTPDPNSGNNSASATTNYDSPQVDLSLTVTDSPDPVTPNNDITYTIPVTNGGPDTATNVNFNSFNNGSLLFQSASVPAGWNCTLPSVGGNPTFTCTKASFAPGTENFTVVVRADQAVLGINDGTVGTAFGVNGTGNDTNQANNNETENTAYITPDADMAVSVTDSPDPVFPDGNITYTVQVSNAGPDTAPNATLNLFNNGSLRYQSFSAPAGWNCTPPAVGAAPTFTCTNPSFANGGNVSFTIVVQADDALLGINDGTVSTAFSVGSGAADPDNLNNSETEDTAYVTPDAELAITNADSPDPVSPGGTITYSQTVTNNGPNAANTTVSQILPASVGFQSIGTPSGFNCTTPAVGASGTITCNNPSFANGGTGTFTLAVTVLAPSGTVVETVQVSSPLQDTVPANNSAQATTTILAAPSADLSLTKTTPTTTGAPGSTVVYTITATNNGPDAATSVVITDTLPASLLFQSISAAAGFNCTTPAVGATGTITCNAASMANGAIATFTLTVTISPSAAGSFSNTAGITSATADSNGGNSSSTTPAIVIASADLSITKSTGATQAQTGSTITYTITVTNNGPDAATGVVVTDNLPTGLQFVSATPSQGSCSGTDPFTCNLGGLANGSSATITLQALVTATNGTIANTATVTAATDDGNPGNDGSTTPSIPVTPGASAEEIPTLSEWALLLMAVILGMVAVVRAR